MTANDLRAALKKAGIRGAQYAGIMSEFGEQLKAGLSAKDAAETAINCELDRAEAALDDLRTALSKWYDVDLVPIDTESKETSTSTEQAEASPWPYTTGRNAGPPPRFSKSKPAHGSYLPAMPLRTAIAKSTG